MIHAALLVAVQLQPLAALTVTVAFTAAGELRFAMNGVSVNAQGAPACVTVKILSPMINVPVRVALVVFAATLYATVPFPVPVAPTPTVIQATLLVAVQLHPVGAVTVTAPLTAIDDINVDETGEMAETQDAPVCVTVKLCPAIVNVPVRPVVAVLAATL